MTSPPPSATRFDTVSFLSDFGLRDEFVGVVHSVIRATAPHVTVIDIAHDLPRHDVRAGSLTLARSVQYLCPGVVLAVVDPGVGTERRRIAVEVGDGQSILVGPDNGVLAPAVAMVGGATKCVELTNTDFHLPAPGPTFDGRDVFAPVVASLCAGTELAELGDPIDLNSLTPGLIGVAREEDGDLVSEVMWVDHFGNCQLNLDPDDIDGWGDTLRARVNEEWRVVRRGHTYADVAEGQIGLIVDSYGLLTLTLNRRAADSELGLRTGSEVRLQRLDEDDQPKGIDTPVQLGRLGDGKR